MDRNTPRSPASPRLEQLPTGFNELVRHNAATSYPREVHGLQIRQSQSQPTSRYGTPVPQPYSTPATSPPTPSRGSDIMTTRSNVTTGSKVLAPRSGRIEKSAPKKKAKKERAKTPKNVPNLDRPMSELTEASQIPVADIETYVHRSSEVRQQEVDTGKNPGRVKRPMNAFMLYRKAYQQRAKEWASQHNHQVVSRVCGLSWPLEPESVRQQFKAWADLERDNHQKAHPDYKFTPSKPQKAKYDDGHKSDNSDLEDFDWVNRTGRGRSTTKTPNEGVGGDYLRPQSGYGMGPYHPIGDHGGMGLSHHQNRSAFDFSNPGRSMPPPYGHRDMPGQYYETQVRNQQHRSGIHHHGLVEDVMMHKTPSPSLAFQQLTHPSSQLHPPLHGHYGLGQYHGHSPASEPLLLPLSPSQPLPLHRFDHHRIDPSLHDPPLMDSHAFNNLLFDTDLGTVPQSWQTAHLPTGHDDAEGGQYSDPFMSYDETLPMDQNASLLKGDWEIEPLSDTAQLDTSWEDPPPQKRESSND
ncbi:hypothetical protein B0T26DRAFT_736306 [Lasiosphaeria miniovina]|uniref:HMG box domain-containing protein n=1 Tax=Lasiosphaeria miniovina TaxID=1954250 RepID=A0AA40BFQ5_9PEZI|nr:uncharacterized protein B0T26DRAFT_736306 [Lasiosphaeria miniovina]KAK0733361.1 hypothetical protein B0T26DRAFT_736306 [Lasiosphaeria miniovina]